MEFDWDKRKATSNLNKHGVSFEEAKSVFYDLDAILIEDPDHSYSEDRFILLGFSSKARLTVVCHCYRKDNSIIRIISARKSTKKESIIYRKIK